MTATVELNLPLLAASQSQKHVTVNEALARLDGLTRLRMISRAETVPPSVVVDGAVYAVPSGATGDWADAVGQLAIGTNGGWVFASPQAGWRGWDIAADEEVLYTGSAWVGIGRQAASGGATTRFEVIEIDHGVMAGASNQTVDVIPGPCAVLGVSARVIAPLTGTATGWQLGVAGSANRYGSGLGVALNSYASGLTGAPVTYWSPTPLLLTAEGGDFAGGMLRIAVHLSRLVPPAAV
ncbi:MAG: DUF2793 domain-containing protein [Pseudomonadota bacterium]